MKITINESPFGDKGKTYDGTLGFFNHLLLQLKSYRSQDKTKEERDYLEADIKGYELVLESGSEENAKNFLKVKTDDRRSDQRKFKNNLEVIEHLKNNNLWKNNQG